MLGDTPSPATDIFNHPAFVEMQRKYLTERAKGVQYENEILALRNTASRAITIIETEMRKLWVFAGSLDKEGQDFIQTIVKRIGVKL